MFDDASLTAILTLNHEGNFRRTAQQLEISAAKLTRLIQKSEKIAGFSIFDRGGKRVTPTVPGRRLIELCSDLSIANQKFSNQLQGIRQQGGGVLRIGSGPLSTHTVAGPLVQQVLEERPGLSIDITVRADEDPVHELRGGQLDLFIGDLTHTTAFDDIEIMRLRREELVFAARPEHPAHLKASHTLPELLSYPLALPYLHRYWQRLFAEALDKTARKPERRVPKVQTDDYQNLVMLAEQSDLVTAGTAGNFVDAFETGRLKQLRVSETVEYNLCCARRREDNPSELQYAWEILGQMRPV